jgi:hypothetical protein
LLLFFCRPKTEDIVRDEIIAIGSEGIFFVVKENLSPPERTQSDDLKWFQCQ